MFRFALIAALTLTAGSAFAAPRKPFVKDPGRVTELKIDRYDTVSRVERVRTPGRTKAVFSAEAGAIESTAALLFRIQSVAADGAVERWSCLAFQDVSECFAGPVAFEYLPGDAKMVLEVSAHPIDEPWVAAIAALRTKELLADR
jgi:hypothetical protein